MALYKSLLNLCICSSIEKRIFCIDNVNNLPKAMYIQNF